MAVSNWFLYIGIFLCASGIGLVVGAIFIAYWGIKTLQESKCGNSYTENNFTNNEDSFDVIFDATSYESAKTCASLMKQGGLFVTTFGQSKGLSSAIISRLFPVQHRTLAVTVESNTDDLNELTELFEKRVLKTALDSEFSFGDINEAYQRSMTGRAKGKIAIKVLESNQATKK